MLNATSNKPDNNNFNETKKQTEKKNCRYIILLFQYNKIIDDDIAQLCAIALL